MIPGPITLLILDGFGDGPRNAFDATFVSGMAHMGDLRRRYASTQLQAGGEGVGLPEGQFGNSEVGHMNLGAGRVVWQELTRIDAAIRKNTFRENPGMAALLAELKASGGRLHLMGLVSDGGVHSHQNHLVALAQWAQAEGVVGFLNAYGLVGRDEFLRAALQTWDFIDAHQIDRVGGEWYSRLTREGEPIPDLDKVDFWKCPYHNTRAMLQIAERARTLVAGSGLA